MTAPLDLLLLNGVVHARPGDAPHQAIGVRDRRVVAIGSNLRLREAAGSTTRVVDLGGRAVLLGFVDSHVHFLSWCLGLRRVQLEGVARLDQALAAVAEAVGRAPDGAWIEGWGWNKNLWGGFPSRADLDRVAPRHPVALTSKDGHALWVNSLALRAAGIDAHTLDPDGGRIVRDERGVPSGVLLERAQERVRSVVPQPSVDVCIAALREGLPAALARGLTGICELGAPEVQHDTLVAAYRAIQQGGELPLRVSLGIPHDLFGHAAILGIWSGFGSARLRIGPLKIFTDGALGPQTAAMLEPYEGSDDRGIPTIERASLEQALQHARRSGIGVALHAIGDAAIRGALDALEATARSVAAPPGTPPPRIEHAQLVHPDDVPRFAQLGVIASMQPIHATSDMEMADRHWGRRARHAYAWRSLIDAGATLAFGTDAPVERIEPLHSLYAAVTRQRENGEPSGGWYPEQCLTLAEAVRAYTHGSAIAGGFERDQGELTPGMLADFVVLADDVFSAPPETLLRTRVEITAIGGEIAFERS